MGKEGRQDGGDEVGGTARPGSVETDSVEWRDVFGGDGRASGSEDTTDEHHELGETEHAGRPREQTEAFAALARASDIFVGLSDPVEDSIHTFVTELPQWFQRPERVEAEIRVGADTAETDGFHRTADPLTAEAHTRTGTSISLTVVCTGRRPDTGARTWLATERELVEALVSLVRDGVDRWEIDSLKRVSDGVVALDGDLTYTYVNQEAERILGLDSEQLCGEFIWDVFPGAADTAVEDKIRTALETQSSTAFEEYYSPQERWVEARVHPGDDGVIIAFNDVTDSKEAKRELDHVLETTPVGIVLLNAEGAIIRANSRAEALLGLSRRNMEGKGYDDPDWDIWDEAGNPIQRDDHPVSHVLETGETVHEFTHGITLPDGSERWVSSNVAPLKTADGSVEEVIVALEDVTVSKRLEQLIEAFQPVEEMLTSATAAEETEQAICELLTETREYQYARIVDHTPGTPLTESQTRGGPENVAVEDPVSLPMHSHTEVAPARVAAETGEIQVVTADQTESRFDRWRAHLLDSGYQGGAIVPLAHRGRVSGLLVLYTDRGAAFGDREQTLLTTFGNRVGHTFHALATERLLHADTVVELTFESTDPGSFFVSASEQLGCTIDIIDAIPASDETLVHYASVQDASLDALGDVAETADVTAECRQIRHTEKPPGGVVEIELQRQSLAQTLVAEGAVVTTDRVTDGRAEVVCEVPADSDIGALVTRVRDSFPETTLVAKRESTPDAKSDAPTAGRVLEDVFENELTDRQQQVLRAAMYGGYFASPRQSTATEIADALSLTQSTFSYHLRNAQQTLFERLFDRVQR